MPVAEVNTKKLGKVTNLCPFGCAESDLDEYGYCHHLLGWTNKGKGVELRDKLPEGARGAGREVTGQKREKVQKTDILIQCGGSSRVYRKEGNPLLKVPERRDFEDFGEAEEDEV